MSTSNNMAATSQTIKRVFLIIGCPGSGKTTLASRLVGHTCAHYSIGEMYRSIAQEPNDLGKMVKSHIDRGQVVPSDIAQSVLLRFLSDAKDTILIDGYPRNMEQVYLLDRILQNPTFRLCGVIEILLPEAVAFRRIVKRNRGTDDNAELFQDRMRVFNQDISEIRSFYQTQQTYKGILGEASVEELVPILREVVYQAQ